MEELVQWLTASQVQVEVNAAVMVEDEVAEDVAALYRLWVESVVLVELRILGVDPFGRGVFRPKPALLAVLAFVHCRTCVA